MRNFTLLLGPRPGAASIVPSGEVGELSAGLWELQSSCGQRGARRTGPADGENWLAAVS